MIQTREVYKDGLLIYTEEYDDGLDEMSIWKSAMAATDVKIPRSVEDIYDVLTEEQKAALPETFRSSVLDKKRLRSEKP